MMLNSATAAVSSRRFGFWRDYLLGTMREPLLAPLAALGTGIVVSRLVGFELSELVWFHVGMAGLAGLALWQRLTKVAAGCVLVALVATGVMLDVLHRTGSRPFIEADPHETVLVEGCVVEPPVFFERREQFVVELASAARARVNVYFKEGERPPDLAYGRRVDLEGRVRVPRNYENPGSFDYVKYLARKQIYWTISVSSPDRVRLLEGRCGSSFQRAIYHLRTTALDRISRFYPEAPVESGLLRAILLGDSSKLERVWKEGFRRTGTYHTLVISGLHVTVLAGCILFFLRIANLGLGWTLLLASMAGWIYALITGWSTPVIRAAAGLTLFLACGYFYRQRRVLNILAAVAIGFLILDSEQLFDPSFQLSFLSVGVIGALAVPLLERTSIPYQRGLAGLGDRDRDLHQAPPVAQFRVELRLLAEALRLWTRAPESWSLPAMAGVLRVLIYLYELAVVSAVIQVGLALPMVAYFHRVSLTGLLANPLVVTLTSLSVPVGFLAILTGWSVPATVAKWLISSSMQVVSFFAGWEGNWRVPDPPGWVMAAFLAALLLAGVTWRVWRSMRTPAMAALAAATGVLLAHPFAPAIEKGVLEVSAIDVGQAESLFLALPGGGTMVVDGGGIPAFGGRKKPELDIGEDVVSPYLWSRSIRRLDVLVSTHAHEDHIGGLAALIDNYHPAELWVTTLAVGPEWDVLREKALASGVRIMALSTGHRFERGGAEFEVLAPPPGEPPTEARNNDSLVLRAGFGRHSFLLTGDIDRNVEEALAREGRLRPCSVLKIPHHGSRTSTSPWLLDATQPVYAVISAGYQNSFGFPSRDVLARLGERRTHILRTDIDGLVTIRTDGKRLHVETRLRPIRSRPLFERRALF